MKKTSYLIMALIFFITGLPMGFSYGATPSLPTNQSNAMSPSVPAFSGMNQSAVNSQNSNSSFSTGPSLPSAPGGPAISTGPSLPSAPTNTDGNNSNVGRQTIQGTAPLLSAPSMQSSFNAPTISLPTLSSSPTTSRSVLTPTHTSTSSSQSRSISLPSTSQNKELPGPSLSSGSSSRSPQLPGVSIPSFAPPAIATPTQDGDSGSPDDSYFPSLEDEYDQNMQSLVQRFGSGLAKLISDGFTRAKKNTYLEWLLIKLGILDDDEYGNVPTSQAT